ncbi:MAG: hypothetical protein HGB19_11255 [Chlorobiales bacterium]|jgi:ElaB/YqjD/DUF883 family membrane-anchored ribosome-binding protein|nr:hypothetical protein [Chlorobiales bacterium]
MQQKEYQYQEQETAPVSNALNENISEYYAHLKTTPVYQTLKKAGDDSIDFIKKNPVKAALISLGAGLLVGFLFSRKR